MKIITEQKVVGDLIRSLSNDMFLRQDLREKVAAIDPDSPTVVEEFKLVFPLWEDASFLNCYYQWINGHSSLSKSARNWRKSHDSSTAGTSTITGKDSPRSLSEEKEMTMKKILLVAALLLGACDVTPPQAQNCVEFDYPTKRAGVPVTCRMVWCEKVEILMDSSGLAMLWCDR